MRLDGIKWGELEMVKELRHGGMAELFLVRRVFGNSEKLVVLKRIQDRFASDPEARALFNSEATLHASLEHIQIVQFLDFGSDRGSLYMALEYMPRGDLFSLFGLLRSQNEDERAGLIMSAFSDIASALRYAHKSVIHQDVSPCNILCTSEMSFKLSDFGVAQKRSQEDQQRKRLARGKFRYMSPEQIAQSQTDPRSDIFSLCATMAEAYCGQKLYGDLSPEQIMKLIRSGDYLKYFHTLRLPGGLAEIILKGVQPCAQDRFQSADELCHALRVLGARALINGPAGVPSGPKVRLTLARKPAHRWAKVFSALLILPIIVFLPWISRIWPSRDPATPL